MTRFSAGSMYIMPKKVSHKSPSARRRTSRSAFIPSSVGEEEKRRARAGNCNLGFYKDEEEESAPSIVASSARSFASDPPAAFDEANLPVT